MTITSPASRVRPVRFLELEITRGCTLTCRHCYSNSGPAAGNGTMTTGDWLRVIEQAPAAGVDTVQLIGGEPTMHQGFLTLAHAALSRGLQVAVFTNFVDVVPDLWELYEDPRVDVSTSWYTDDPDEHYRITRVAGAYEATLANIREALRRGVDPRVKIVRQVIPGQRDQDAVAQMAEIGVTRLRWEGFARPVGRASRGTDPELVDLCGLCADGRAAILTDGSLTACVLGQHLVAGSVLDAPLLELLEGPRWRQIAEMIPRPAAGSCQGCGPTDSNDCDPSK